MAWKGSSTKSYTIEQWRKACLIYTGGDKELKSSYKLPVRDPNGKLNCKGLNSAKRMVGHVKGISSEEIDKIRTKIDNMLKKC